MEFVLGEGIDPATTDAELLNQLKENQVKGRNNARVNHVNC